MSGDRPDGTRIVWTAATRRLSVTVEFEVIGDPSDDDLLEFLRGFVGSSTTGGIPHRHVQVVDVHRLGDLVSGDGTYRRLASAILVAHQRRADGNCLCGGLTLGESWADHVALILDTAGALRHRPPRVAAREGADDA